MKRLPSHLWCVLSFALLFVEAPAVVVYWSGLLPTGWRGGATPANGDSVYLGTAINQDVTLAGGLSLSTVVLAANGNTYAIDAASAVTLGLTGGLVAGDSGFSRLVVEPHVTLSVAGTQAFDAGNSTVVVYSKLTGTGSPIFLANGGSGSFLFVNVGGANDYTGNTVVGDGSHAPTFAFWNGSPFGSTGSVNILNGATLIAHGTETITNSLTLNSAGSSNPLILRSWDAPLTLSGAVTFANNVSLTAQTSAAAYGYANGAGSLPVPGQTNRNPILITGTISESGGARSLTVQGQGIVILAPASGSNTYSGGITSNGVLVFGNNNAIPAAGTITSGTTGYVGFGDLSAGNFATQVSAHVSKSSGGSIGVDTLPGNATATLADNIDLSSSGLSFTNGGIRFGTATSAILTGTFKPQGSNYAFGGGGGTLYVQSALGNVPTFASQLQLNNNGGTPLKLFLQGANTYTGGTSASNGILVFDGASAIPASGTLTAGGNNSSVGNSYVGYTDAAGVNGGSLVGANPAAFLAKFNAAATWGIVGFDTHAGSATVNISGPVNLSGFNNGVFLGTATSAILSGTITPTAVAAGGGNAANTLRLTAANGGTLTVTSSLADTLAPLTLMLGTPTTTNPYLANGTVNLNGANTYSGGTILNAGGQGLTVGVGTNGAFGTGTISIATSVSGLVGLQALSPGLTVANNISFTNPASLYLQGANALSLTGALSGTGTLQLQRMTNDAAGAATLAGNNSAFTGDINLQNSALTLKSNNAAGQANLNFFDSAATAIFGGAATAPVLHGISGDSGSLVLPNGTGTVLTFQMDDDSTHSGDFGGVISGAGGTATDAAIVVTANNSNNNATLYLHGHNLYTGGTTISGYGVLGLGASDSAGSGPVTVSASNGGLILNTGVTLTNPLVFTSGGLAGLGSFAPSIVSGTGQTAGKITFGSGQFAYPGIPVGDTQIPGVLTIQTNVAFAAGGGLREMIQDPASLTTAALSAGTSLLYVQGDLDLSLAGVSSFTIAVESINSANERGFSGAIAWGQSYTVPIVQTTGSVLGFNASSFTFDTSQFQNGLVPAGYFSVTADTNHLYLNFTAVPEPSTWALLVSGAGLLGLAAVRRRHRA